MHPTVLIVDDEASFCGMLVEFLRDSGYTVDGAGTAEEALTFLDKKRYDVVFSDIRMPGMSGIELLSEIKKRDPSIDVIIVTSHSSISNTIEALRLGASDFLMKPLEDIDLVLPILRRSSEKLALEAEKRKLVVDLQRTNSDLEESRQQIIQHFQDISALYEAEKQILSGLDLTEVYQRSAGYLSRLLGLRPVIIWTLSQSGQRLLTMAQSGFELMEEQDWDIDLPQAAAAYPWELGEEHKKALMLKGAFRSALFHPVAGHQKLIGYVGAFDGTQEAFSDRDWEILSRFCVSVAMALENARLYEKVKALAICDGLTGLYNRRHFEETVKLEIMRSERHQHPVSLLFIDVDHFKNYNDAQGHIMGDVVLQQMAEVILERVRATDIVCRYGGEEFTVVLPFTDQAGALKLAEEIRALVEGHPFPHRDQQPGGTVTISIGVSECPTNAKTPEEIVKIADANLYRAKAAGRNQVAG